MSVRVYLPMLQAFSSTKPARESRILPSSRLWQMTPELLLHISELNWDYEYRNSSWLGATALRSILLNSSLANMWAVSIYIPDDECRYTPEEQAISHERNISTALDASQRKTAEDFEAPERWRKRRHDLRIQDTRQFLQAGFQQVKETILKTSCMHLFAVPSFLTVPILTCEDTRSLEIYEENTSASLTPT